MKFIVCKLKIKIAKWFWRSCQLCELYVFGVEIENLSQGIKGVRRGWCEGVVDSSTSIISFLKRDNKFTA